MKVFKKYSDIALNSGVNALRDYKRDLIHKDRIFLLELCYQVIAYNTGILMQAWKDYPGKSLEAKSIINHVTQDVEYFGKNNIQQAEDKVDNQFRSSFDNKYSKKIQELNLTAELMRIVPNYKEVLTLEGDSEAVTLNEDLKKNLLPTYNNLRLKRARSLQIIFKLSNKILSQLQLLAFDEVISLVYGKKQVNKSLIQFLEQAIDVYFPMFLKDLGISNKTNLIQLRKNLGHKFNTVCYRCGLRLFKTDNKHYCIRRENRSCYDARYKEDRDSGFPRVILRTKNRCENCGRYSPLNFTPKHKGIERQFCSKKCVETYRKRDYRKIKSTSFIPIP